MIKISRVFILLCGLWSLGLGARYTVELYFADSYICVPRNALYGVNLWFDFIPLSLFGLFTTISILREIISSFYREEVSSSSK